MLKARPWPCMAPPWPCMAPPPGKLPGRLSLMLSSRGSENQWHSCKFLKSADTSWLLDATPRRASTSPRRSIAWKCTPMGNALATSSNMRATVPRRASSARMASMRTPISRWRCRSRSTSSIRRSNSASFRCRMPLRLPCPSATAPWCRASITTSAKAPAKTPPSCRPNSRLRRRRWPSRHGSRLTAGITTRPAAPSRRP